MNNACFPLKEVSVVQ